MSTFCINEHFWLGDKNLISRSMEETGITKKLLARLVTRSAFAL
jgi:hypothetical protein